MIRLSLRTAQNKARHLKHGEKGASESLLVKVQHLIGSVEWREFSGPITYQSDRHKSNAIEY